MMNRINSPDSPQTNMIETGKRGARKVLRLVRRRSRRNLFWWKGPPYNAGDWVGPFLYHAISSQEPIYRESSNRSLSTVFLTVGSLTRWICEDSIIWGSGLLYRDESFWEPYETCAVRGPYTRQRFLELGYPCPSVFGDPAILLPKYLQLPQSVEHRIGIVPHYSNFQQVMELYDQDPEVCVIDIRWPLKEVIKTMLSCACVVSSSLHGLIFAHSYGIPAAQVEFAERPGGDGIKYLDYYAAGGIQTPERPLIIEQKISVTEFEQYVSGSPQPDLDPLIAPLLEACPFA